MTRGQRRAHFRIWLAMALVLPPLLAAILALAPGSLNERAPVHLTEGGGG